MTRRALLLLLLLLCAPAGAPQPTLRDLLASIDERLKTLDARTDSQLSRVESRLARVETRVSEQLPRKVDALSDKVGARAARLHAKMEELEGRSCCCRDEEPLERRLGNLTAALEGQGLLLRELDSDLETYSRKVVNGVQELWRASDETAQGLRALREEAEHAPGLQLQLQQLSAGVEASFATLLVAQNAFIDSCRRVQHEEARVFDALRQVVLEVRGRAEEGVQRIGRQLSAHADRVERALRSGCGPGSANGTTADMLYDFDEDYHADYPERT